MLEPINKSEFSKNSRKEAQKVFFDFFKNMVKSRKQAHEKIKFFKNLERNLAPVFQNFWMVLEKQAS